MELETAIGRIAQGDHEALTILYEGLGRLVFSVAYGITGNYQDAEDVLSQTMLEIVQYAASYRSGTNPKAWVLTMARHEALDVVRRNKRRTQLDESKLTQPAEQSALAVLEMLSCLDLKERQLLLFRLYAGLTYEETARVMGISVFAAQKRYQRILKKLRTEAGGTDNG